MKQIHFAIFTLLLLAIAPGYAPAQPTKTEVSPVEEIVYTKPLPDKAKLVVSRVDAALAPLSRQEQEELERKKAELRKQSPTARFLVPDRASRYSVFLDSADGQSHRLLWQRTIPEFSELLGQPVSKHQFFDVALESETLIVVYSSLSGLVGEVAKLDDSKTNGAIQPQWLMLVTIDIAMAAGVSFVKSANLSGSLKNGNLSITIQKIDGNTSRFIWKDGWVSLASKT